MFLIGAYLTREQVDRGIYEAIRLKLLADEWCADVTQPVDQAGYDEAMATLRETKDDGILIEVEGVATGDSRLTYKQNRIYIDYKGSMTGGISGKQKVFVEYEDEEEETKFKQFLTPDASSDLLYEIHYSTDSTKYDRIIENIILSALGDRRKINGIKNDWTNAQGFYIMKIDYVDLSDKTCFERKFMYSAKDIWLLTPTELRTNIAPMSDITTLLDEDSATNVIPE